MESGGGTNRRFVPFRGDATPEGRMGRARRFEMALSLNRWFVQTDSYTKHYSMGRRPYTDCTLGLGVKCTLVEFALLDAVISIV